MRRETLVYTSLFVGAGLIALAVPGWSGEIGFSEVIGRSLIVLDTACKGKNIPPLHATIPYPPDDFSVEDINSGALEAKLSCRLTAFRNGTPVKGFRANVQASTVTISDTGEGQVVHIGGMVMRTKASGERDATIVSGGEIALPVPLVGELPYVGALFRAKPKGNTKADLVSLRCRISIDAE